MKHVKPTVVNVAVVQDVKVGNFGMQGPEEGGPEEGGPEAGPWTSGNARRRWR